MCRVSRSEIIVETEERTSNALSRLGALDLVGQMSSNAVLIQGEADHVRSYHDPIRVEIEPRDPNAAASLRRTQDETLQVNAATTRFGALCDLRGRLFDVGPEPSEEQLRFIAADQADPLKRSEEMADSKGVICSVCRKSSDSEIDEFNCASRKLTVRREVDLAGVIVDGIAGSPVPSLVSSQKLYGLVSGYGAVCFLRLRRGIR